MIICLSSGGVLTGKAAEGYTSPCRGTGEKIGIACIEVPSGAITGNIKTFDRIAILVNGIDI